MRGAMPFACSLTFCFQRKLECVHSGIMLASDRYRSTTPAVAVQITIPFSVVANAFAGTGLTSAEWTTLGSIAFPEGRESMQTIQYNNTQPDV